MDVEPGSVIPRPTFNMGVVCLAVIVFVTLLWKELKLVSFDSELATSQGFNSNIIHYLMMAMVAGVTVAAFEAVGSILVVAMLTVPAATAYMLTDRLSLMVVAACVCGVISAVLGRDFASRLDTSVPGMMAVVAGGLFTVAVLVAPRHGVLVKRLRQVGLSLRIVREDILAMLYRWQELSPQQALKRAQASSALGGGLLPALAIWTLEREGRIRSALAAEGVSGILLTEKGRAEAQTLVKTHRLWETYLMKLGLPQDHLHAPADRAEHFVSEQVMREVAREVENPTTDPHGKPIPRREGSRVDLKSVNDED